MRILQLNNLDRRDGGAETVTAHTGDLLRDAGHEVLHFAGSHRPSQAVYSLRSRRALARLLRVTKPDVAHAHNVYGRLTLSVLDALDAAGIPTVLTLHDYRAVCPNGILLAPDGPCRRCVEGTVAHAVRLGCLHGSRYASAVAAVEVALNRRRGAYAKADLLICPSHTMERIVSEAGLPAGRLEVVPNAVRASAAPRGKPPLPASFVFAGRLTPAKGLHTLLAAARRLPDGARVVVLGSGRQEAVLRRSAAGLPMEIRGAADAAEVRRELARATAVVVPSLWIENCPMAILEAGALGVPAVASDLGGMRELVADGHDGLLVPPGRPAALAGALRTLAEDPELVARLGERAWERVRARHAPDGYRAAILSCYERARRLRARRGGASGGGDA
jgi:glycosyltransferase involved in cell wall biosynthesis